MSEKADGGLPLREATTTRATTYHYIMQRTRISLTTEARRILNAVSARRGKSTSALIRDAVETVYGDQRPAEEDLVTMRRSRGAWSRGDSGGEAWVDRLRSGSRIAPPSS